MAATTAPPETCPHELGATDCIVCAIAPIPAPDLRRSPRPLPADLQPPT